MGPQPSALARRLLGADWDMAAVERALKAVMDSGAAFVPTLPQLLQFGFPAKARARARLAHLLIPSWERRTCSREQLERIAAANLERARELLAGVGEEPSARERQVLERLASEVSAELEVEAVIMLAQENARGSA